MTHAFPFRRPGARPTSVARPALADPPAAGRATALPSRASLAALAPLASLVLSAALAGCAAPLRPAKPTPVAVQSLAAPAWQAPLPHGGATADLVRWWDRFDDPVLPWLVQAAQAANPSLATAALRVAQARADATVAGAALLPRLDLQAQASRGRDTPQAPLATTGGLGQAFSWEIDLFGANRAGRDAATARLKAAEAGWHDARVLVAAEVAQQYLALRACEAQRALAEDDARSRAQTDRLTDTLAAAGLQSPSVAALARASAAQARSAVVAREAACQSLVKVLVELTGLPEPQLTAQLAAGRARLPQAPALAVSALPAGLMAQRPDVAAAALQTQAAADALVQAGAQRLPRLTLEGNFGRARVESGPFVQQGRVWTFGPVALSLPLFDGGRLAAGEAVARAAYADAEVQLKARVRTAVREVEQSLIDLDSARRRSADLRAAADDYRRSLEGAEVRQRVGLASLFELEDARRTAVLAESAWIDWQREQAVAWVALYRALGGGWQAGAPAP